MAIWMDWQSVLHFTWWRLIILIAGKYNTPAYPSELRGQKIGISTDFEWSVGFVKRCTDLLAWNCWPFTGKWITVQVWIHLRTSILGFLHKLPFSELHNWCAKIVMWASTQGEYYSLSTLNLLKCFEVSAWLSDSWKVREILKWLQKANHVRTIAKDSVKLSSTVGYNTPRLPLQQQPGGSEPVAVWPKLASWAAARNDQDNERRLLCSNQANQL